MINNKNSLSYESDGQIAAFDLTISHKSDFDLVLTDDELVASAKSQENSTRLIVIMPSGSKIFNTNGLFEIQDIEVLSRDGDVNILRPDQFSLSEAYPNPFNPVTMFNISIDVERSLEIAVFNIAGQLVETIHTGYISAGFHQFEWEAKDLASGLYIIKANDGASVVSQKVMLLK